MSSHQDDPLGQDTLYCEATCDLEDVFYLGSDDDDYDTPADRKLRIDAAARRFLAGNEPLILSAGLRGPFESNTGWVNPWRSGSQQPSIRASCSALGKTIQCSPDRRAEKAISLESHLPSPQDHGQDSDDAHPFLYGHELDSVQKWRTSVKPTSIENDCSWATDPSPSHGRRVVGKKRHAPDSGWLRTATSKRPKTSFEDAANGGLSLRQSISGPSMSNLHGPLSSLNKSSIPQATKLPPTTQKGLIFQQYDDALEPPPKSNEMDELMEEVPQHRPFGVACCTRIPSVRISPRRDLQKFREKDHDEEDELSQESMADIKAALTLSSPVSNKCITPRAARLRFSPTYHRSSPLALNNHPSSRSDEQSDIPESLEANIRIEDVEDFEVNDATSQDEFDSAAESEMQHGELPPLDNQSLNAELANRSSPLINSSETNCNAIPNESDDDVEASSTMSCSEANEVNEDNETPKADSMDHDGSPGSLVSSINSRGIDEDEELSILSEARMRELSAELQDDEYGEAVQSSPSSKDSLTSRTINPLHYSTEKAEKRCGYNLVHNVHDVPATTTNIDVLMEDIMPDLLNEARSPISRTTEDAITNSHKKTGMESPDHSDMHDEIPLVDPPVPLPLSISSSTKPDDMTTRPTNTPFIALLLNSTSSGDESIPSGNATRPNTPRPATPQSRPSFPDFSAWMTPSPERRARQQARQQITAKLPGPGELRSSLKKSENTSTPKPRVSWAPLPVLDWRSEIAVGEDSRASSPPPPPQPTPSQDSLVAPDVHFASHFQVVSKSSSPRQHTNVTSPTTIIISTPTTTTTTSLQPCKEPGLYDALDEDLNLNDDDDDLTTDLFKSIELLQPWDLDKELEDARKVGSTSLSCLDY